MSSKDIQILYEDKDVLAINKPAGLVVHSDGRSTLLTAGRSTTLTTSKTEERTLVDWIMQKYPEIENVGEPIRIESRVKSEESRVILRPGIVHRLDRDTSGVMLIAKTKESFENLKQQFKDHEIVKKYEAFVFGEMKSGEGEIDRSIGRSKSDFRKWSAQRGARGEMREAKTDYRVLFKNKEYSFVELLPKTGRTHQIRVHMKAINHPLVGDSLYAPKKDNTLGFSRTALHSKEITFMGINGKSYTVLAPYPEDFIEAKKALGIK